MVDALQLPLDLLRDDPQGQLAQGGEVRLGEEPVEGHLGPLGRVHVAVAHPLPERVRAHVDELDLLGAEEDLVGEPLVHRAPR